MWFRLETILNNIDMKKHHDLTIFLALIDNWSLETFLIAYYLHYLTWTEVDESDSS